MTRDKERERHEEERLDSVREYIGYRAHLYSRDAPDQKEDIEQIAREAVVRQLRDDPDCPISHLKVVAKSAILNYRKQGKSVDGKLNESDRSLTYDSLSLDASVTEDDCSCLEEVLGESSFVGRITEERALHHISMDALRDKLSPKENRVLSMRLDGASWQEVIGELGYSAGESGSPARRRIEQAAGRVFGTSAPPGNGKNGGGRSF